jgi:hypothetical protein
VVANLGRPHYAKIRREVGILYMKNATMANAVNVMAGATILPPDCTECRNLQGEAKASRGLKPALHAGLCYIDGWA